MTEIYLFGKCRNSFAFDSFIDFSFNLITEEGVSEIEKWSDYKIIHTDC